MAEMDDSGLLYEASTGGDKWIGTADQLINAGLIERRLCPGEPGNNKVQITYYRGAPIGKGWSGAPCDENHLCIERYGKNRFIVTKGVSAEERLRRETRKRFIENQSDIDFRSIVPPKFS